MATAGPEELENGSFIMPLIDGRKEIHLQLEPAPECARKVLLTFIAYLGVDSVHQRRLAFLPGRAGFLNINSVNTKLLTI